MILLAYRATSPKTWEPYDLDSRIRTKYLETKKLHHSQRTSNGAIYQLDLIPNLVLEARILEFASDMELLSPDFLRMETGKGEGYGEVV